MKKLEKILMWFIGIILAIFIFNYLDAKCNSKDQYSKIAISKHPKEISNIKPFAQVEPTKQDVNNVIYINKYLIDSVFIFDTIRIKEYITKYLTKNVFLDTAFNNDSIFLSVLDSVYMNTISYRKYNLELRNKTVIKQPKQNNYYITVGSQLHQEINVSFGLKYRHKNNMFGANYSTNKVLSLEYSYRLR